MKIARKISSTKPRRSLSLQGEHENAKMLAYGLARWREANGREPTFRTAVELPDDPFEVFSTLDALRASHLTENAFFVASHPDAVRRTGLTYGEATRLESTAVVCSVYLWVRSEVRLPCPDSDDPLERRMADFVRMVEERPAKFRRLQSWEKDSSMAESAGRLAASSEASRERLQHMLSTALAGCTGRELEYFNRYYFVAKRLRNEFTGSGAERLSTAEWVYILSGDRDVPHLQQTILKLSRLLESGRLVQDPLTQRLVPAGPDELAPDRRTVNPSASSEDPHVRGAAAFE